MTARTAFCRDYSIIFQFVLQKSRYPPSYLHIIFPLLPTASTPATPCSKHIVLFPHLSHYPFLWITKVWLCFVIWFLDTYASYQTCLRYFIGFCCILYLFVLHASTEVEVYLNITTMWKKKYFEIKHNLPLSFPFTNPSHSLNHCILMQ